MHPTSRTRSLPWLILLLALATAAAGGAFIANRQHRREVASLRTEVATLTSAQTALRKEMGELREASKRQPATAAASATSTPRREIVLTVDGAPFKGNPNAPLTLVEFTDYECAFCARHVRETIPQLERDYIATGKLKYVFRSFPLESVHKQAFKAHEAASCASEQGRFWEMHDLLFTNHRALGPADIAAHVTTLGLDAQRLQACVDLGLRAAEIRRDVVEGRQAGVTATPAFYLGRTQRNSPTMKVVTTLKGAKPYSAFTEAIDALLAAPPAS